MEVNLTVYEMPKPLIFKYYIIIAFYNIAYSFIFNVKLFTFFLMLYIQIQSIKFTK